VCGLVLHSKPCVKGSIPEKCTNFTYHVNSILVIPSPWSSCSIMAVRSDSSNSTSQICHYSRLSHNPYPSIMVRSYGFSGSMGFQEGTKNRLHPTKIFVTNYLGSFCVLMHYSKLSMRKVVSYTSRNKGMRLV
jgi:hypothetical protein